MEVGGDRLIKLWFQGLLHCLKCRVITHYFCACSDYSCSVQIKRSRGVLRVRDLWCFEGKGLGVFEG